VRGGACTRGGDYTTINTVVHYMDCVIIVCVTPKCIVILAAEEIIYKIHFQPSLCYEVSTSGYC
jgi:hypothetical protein